MFGKLVLLKREFHPKGKRKWRTGLYHRVQYAPCDSIVPGSQQAPIIQALSCPFQYQTIPMDPDTKPTSGVSRAWLAPVNLRSRSVLTDSGTRLFPIYSSPKRAHLLTQVLELSMQGLKQQACSNTPKYGPLSLWMDWLAKSLFIKASI